MLTALIGSYCAANIDNCLEACACAVTSMGLAGELAFERVSIHGLGTSTLRTFIIDEISNMTIDTLTGGAKVEVR